MPLTFPQATPEQLNTLAKNLQKLLPAKLGVAKVPLNQAQEIAAQALGHENYHAAQVALSQAPVAHAPATAPAFTFPRDPNSAFNYIDSGAVRQAVLVLTEGMDRVQQDAQYYEDRNLRAMLDGQGAWNLASVCKTALMCATLRGLDDRHYETALVKQVLLDFGFGPSEKPTILPPHAPSRDLASKEPSVGGPVKKRLRIRH